MLAAKVKPRFRGVSHQIAFFVALLAGGLLIAATAPGRARAAVTIFAVSLAWLLGASALYHRPMWTPEARARLKRLDHASIFFLIAGTYTPLCLLALRPEHGRPLLIAVWVGGALGAILALAWPNRPRVLSAAIYVVLGLSAMAYVVPISAALDPLALALFGAGGVFYISGAVIYALRWPNPRPAVFGYHELFHALVVVACASHFAAIMIVVRDSGHLRWASAVAEVPSAFE